MAELTVLNHCIKVCSFRKEDLGSFMHPLVDMTLIRRNESLRPRFFTLTETTVDYSLLLDVSVFEHLFKDHPEKLMVAKSEWVPIIMTPGQITDTSPSSGIANIAKSVIIPLADADISVYCLSTYSTDYVLVKEDDLCKAVEVLATNFRILRVSGSEGHEEEIAPGPTSPSRPRSAESGPRTPTKSPSPPLRLVTHDFTMPENNFHLMHVARGLLQKSTQMIIDLMFYASRGHTTSPNHEVFFSIVIVDDVASLVVDSDCLKRHCTGRAKEEHIMIEPELYRMVKIGDMPDGLGFEIAGIVAQVSEPLAEANILEYYISSCFYGHVLVPDKAYKDVVRLLQDRRQEHQLPLLETPPAEPVDGVPMETGISPSETNGSNISGAAERAEAISCHDPMYAVSDSPKLTNGHSSQQ